MKNKNNAKTIFVSIIAICTASASVAQAQAQTQNQAVSFGDAIAGGKFQFDARLRYEYVDQIGLPNNANATTLRSKVNFHTKKFIGLAALIEVENITDLFGGEFNNTINGKTTYPVVADPNDTLLNRLFVEYSGINKTSIIIGRQTINLNNQRHVGAVGWRQNDQTFDAISFKNNSIANTEIFYTYSTQVNRVFGTNSAQGVWKDTQIHLLNLTYNSKSFGKLAAYNYSLDIPQAAALSTQTTGFRYEITKPIKGAKVGLGLEIANQKDFANNSANIDLNYYSIEPSFGLGNWQVKAQYESIEGNGVRAFQFPLGTNHAFDGWVDKFLTTPANGLIDLNIGLNYKVKSAYKLFDGAKLSIIYHDFASQNGGAKYGSELNGIIEQSFGKNISLGAKFGKYNANGLFTDTTKIMPYIGYKF